MVRPDLVYILNVKCFFLNAGIGPKTLNSRHFLKNVVKHFDAVPSSFHQRFYGAEKGRKVETKKRVIRIWDR